MFNLTVTVVSGLPEQKEHLFGGQTVTDQSG